MHVKNYFNKLANIDTNSKEYLNFSNALFDVNWNDGTLQQSTAILSYAPGFTFYNIPFMNDHPGFKKNWGNSSNSDEHKDASVVKVRKESIAFFEMIEKLVPNHRVIRSEVLMELPNKISFTDEISRMHIDSKVFHSHAKRCQIAIATNENCFLNVEHKQMSIPVGSLYEFDNKECHWGVNYGNSPRIVVIVDMIDVNVWANLNSVIKEHFFETNTPLIKGEIERYNKFIAEFKIKHNLS